MFARPGKTTDMNQPMAEDDDEEVLDLKLVVGGRATGTPEEAVLPPETVPDTMQAPNPADQIANEIYGTMIGEDTTITGNLVSPQEIFVAGEVQGDITCRRLIANSAARIHGCVTADEVVVDGTMQGPIRALRVTLQPNSRVHGHIFYQSIAVEKGADFEGVARQSDTPKQFDHTTAMEQQAVETAPVPQPKPRAADGTPAAANVGNVAQAVPAYQAVRPAPSGYRPVANQAPQPSGPVLKRAS